MTEHDILLTLLVMPKAAAHARYLDEVCGGDNPLRGRVEALLRSHESEALSVARLPRGCPRPMRTT
jgi:hypothetical protein